MDKDPIFLTLHPTDNDTLLHSSRMSEKGLWANFIHDTLALGTDGRALYRS
jgi:hypothetical protein